MTTCFVLLAVYVHIIFFYLLIKREHEFDAPMLGLFTLGVTVAAVGFFNPHTIQLSDGTRFTRQEVMVVKDKAQVVHDAVESVLKDAPAGKIDPSVIAKEIKDAQKQTNIEIEISKETGRKIVLPEKSMEELAKELAELKDEKARRDLIMDAYLGLGNSEKNDGYIPARKRKTILEVFEGK